MQFYNCAFRCVRLLLPLLFFLNVEWRQHSRWSIFYAMRSNKFALATFILGLPFRIYRDRIWVVVLYVLSVILVLAQYMNYKCNIVLRRLQFISYHRSLAGQFFILQPSISNWKPNFGSYFFISVCSCRAVVPYSSDGRKCAYWELCHT